jgi:hypothetical protein
MVSTEPGALFLSPWISTASHSLGTGHCPHSLTTRHPQEIGFVFFGSPPPRFVLSHNAPIINTWQRGEQIGFVLHFFFHRGSVPHRIHWPLVTVRIHSPLTTRKKLASFFPPRHHQGSS